MNPKTTIYIAFKEYVDAGTEPSRPYINGDCFAPDKVKIGVTAATTCIFSVLDYFQYEHRIILYDRQNLESLLYPASLLKEEYPGLKRTILAKIRDRGFSDWKDHKVKENGTRHILENGMDVTDDMLGDMATRQKSGEIPCILIQDGAIEASKGCIILHGSNKTRYCLATSCNIRAIHKWLFLNRAPKRTYHFNPKHGDADHPSQDYTDRHGNHHRAAQLLTNTDVTNELLKKAVGRDQTSELWYYDTTNGCFIYFENEGDTPQPEFHAYHLHPGDENFDNIDINKLRQVQTIP